MNWIISGSGNGLSPVRRQAITWSNDGLLWIGLLETSFSEPWIGILSFSSKKVHFKISKCSLPIWRPFCPGRGELTQLHPWPLLYATTLTDPCGTPTHLTLTLTGTSRYLYQTIPQLLTHRGRNKMAHISQTVFRHNFLEYFFNFQQINLFSLRRSFFLLQARHY